MARETELQAFNRRSAQQDFREQLRMSLMEEEDNQRRDSATQLEDYITSQINEELQIRVQNFDKNTVVMWTIEQFQDRLEMLRDSLAQFEDKKQRKAQ